MGQQSSKVGCTILAAVIGVISVVVIAIVGMYTLKRADTEHAMETAQSHFMDPVEAGSGERLVFADSDRPILVVPGPGEPVTLEMIMGYMTDDAATDLAKDGFRKVADKTQVSWKMRLKQVSDRNGELRGDFDVPWQVRHDHGSFGSSFSVNVVFDEAGRAELLKLRRGDWIEVEGQLLLAQGSPTIVQGMVVEKP